MGTVKELVFKAFCENLVVRVDTLTPKLNQLLIEEFEKFWKINFCDNILYNTNVFIDGKEYLMVDNTEYYTVPQKLCTE